MAATTPSLAEIRAAVDEYIAGLSDRLFELNQKIHQRPELAYKEHYAHDTICDFLETLGFAPTRHAYGLDTAFELISGSPDDDARTVNFNAEYDALPDIGHGCGHNLIATASITAFLGLAHAIDKFGLNGRTQLLGTPAEEDGGGKIDLLNAGAYKHVDVSLMLHPETEDAFTKFGAIGSGGLGAVACYDIICRYTGVSAHSSACPYEGINALDAVVAAYNNISMLRQQIRPEERIHGTILHAPKITNAVPELAVTKYTVRSATATGARALGARVRKCLEAGALATGCSLAFDESPVMADLRINTPLCDSWKAHMAAQGERILDPDPHDLSGSTDQGNVTHAVPGLHALLGIPVVDAANIHTHGFAAAAATPFAHDRTVMGGKALAMTGVDVLLDEEFYARVVRDFEEDKKRR
ncbi:hypothetical protein LOZ61_002936 [Ophidiomyces ophidiicola]|nr:hypothetical protein LOZ61_002936 [Ophidiomyces ophidiicola]KAI1920728.1 hypothetical protein LOZ64_001776 [Ophidiomyces ophidiicola]KAI1928581.1 hypothetical protein LOZ60_002302 [Ophidiomyces ophidiicola]KAI1961227.1 hypothetical protein LOZ59_002476 [Ophidiomyces ophidiicola]KAI2008800.1 hypothetical protein LOZ49_004117 [Ophidiomyces ophidiicola]